MKEIREPARLTPVLAETDVLVVGSGPGGRSAAVSSARAGVPTMLVERYSCLGGNLTHVGVESRLCYVRCQSYAILSRQSFAGVCRASSMDRA
jgi:pyruvate/2-oxoglutarate dehydrogenase complex dihydrolipoamide dehydrogenase (E3) component